MGNWMADEVLWRSGIHPGQKAVKFRGLRKKFFSNKFFSWPVGR
jgi:formamidopyrimidine-DNA glycosylase